MANKKPSLLKRILLWAVVIVGLLYGAVLVYFKVKGPSLIFAPRTDTWTVPASLQLNPTVVHLKPETGVDLQAWVLPAQKPDSSANWVLFLHGNNSNMTALEDARRDALFRSIGLNVFTLDYRGYGQSTGTPSEPGLNADARAGYNYLRETLLVPANHIFIYGYSFGSGPATELAAQVPAAGLILDGGLASVPEIAYDTHPYLPIKLLTDIRFDNAARIPAVSMPKLFLHAADDSTVLHRYGEEVFAAAHEPKTFVTLTGGHTADVVVDHDKMKAAIAAFVSRNGSISNP